MHAGLDEVQDTVWGVDRTMIIRARHGNESATLSLLKESHTADHSLPEFPWKPQGFSHESWMQWEPLQAVPLWGGVRPAGSLQGGDSPSRAARQVTRLCPQGHPQLHPDPKQEGSFGANST